MKQLRIKFGVEMTEKNTFLFNIFAPSEATMAACEEAIAEILSPDVVCEYEFGGIYSAQIVDMQENGHGYAAGLDRANIYSSHTVG